MKIKKILFLVLSFILLNSIVYAKYIYNFNEEIIVLKRDTELPNCTISYSTQECTKENVIITLECNKQVEQISGFEISEDKKTLTKIVTENESKVVTLRDMSGNCNTVEYSVTNIDKEIPKIIGCENNGVYDDPVNLKFEDNNEIKSISIDKYSNDLKIEYNKEFFEYASYDELEQSKDKIYIRVKEHPLNTVNYKYYINDNIYSTSSDTEYIYTGLETEREYLVKVQALDCNGNVLKEATMNVTSGYFEYINYNKTIKNSDEVVYEVEKEKENDKYCLIESGNYQIKVIDLAGNEVEYFIEIK